MASRFLTPFSTSRRLPASSLMDLQNEFGRLIESAFSDFGLAPMGAAGFVQPPRLDMTENDREFCVSADLPGVQASDLDVRLDQDVLTISGERRNESQSGQGEQNQPNYHVMERSYGRFTRSVQLPFTPQPEQVQAQFKDGVLTLRIPKQPQQEQSRRIQIQTGEGAGLQQQAAGDGQRAEQPGMPQGGSSPQAGRGTQPGTTH